MSSNKLKEWKVFDFGPEINKNTKHSDSHKEKRSKSKIKKPNNVVFSAQTINFNRKLEPKVFSDLAVHPKKIQEVENWFKSNVCQKNPNVKKFLLLSGPTGAGKTSTVSVLCSVLNISISEWVNPLDQDYEYKGMNQLDCFLEFLSDSKYGSLFDNNLYKITLVKDFPNVIIQKPEEFHDILEDYMYKSNQPIVFICTDISSSNLNLQRSLFPDEIIQKFNIDHISFNSCAPTLMKNALKRAQEIVKLHPEIYKAPPSSMIDAIIASAEGDIRNAINQYHIASLLGTGDLPTIQSQSDQQSKKRKRSENLKQTLMNKDQNLGLFHGVGRVLNPKRKQVGNSWRLTHNVDSLIDEFSNQPQSFTAFLFENYLKYFGSIVDVAKSAEILSLSLKFLDNWDRPDTMVFALWFSVLGLMVYNENRVSNWTPIRGPVKIKPRIQKEDNQLNPIDFYYFNVINKSDKYHKFNINK